MTDLEYLYRHGDEHVGAHSARIAPGKMAASARIFRAARADAAVAANADDQVARASSSSGAPLPSEIRTQFEGSLGADLSAVRLHTGADSAQAATAVGARAYAIGNDIHFASGQYAPTDPFGIHLLAHEVAHTQQQAGGTPMRQHKLEVSAPGDAAEVEADRAADAMVAGARFAISSSGAPLALRRKLNEEDKKIWTSQGGDTCVTAIKGSVAGWMAFRAKPTSLKAALAFPADSANKLWHIIESAPNYAGHAAGELGPEALVAIGEMASFGVGGFNNLADKLPGVTVTKSLGHKLTLAKNATLSNSVPMFPITSVTITYTNALGWSWSRDFGITGLSLKASSKGWGVSSGVDISAEATAEPFTYRGFEDFNGAAVSVTNGPKISTNWAGLNGKASSGGVISMVANGVTTQFTMRLKASSGPALPGSKGQAIDIGVGQGGGAATAAGDTTVTMPQITKKVAQVSRPYGPFIMKGFATGSADCDPAALAGVSRQLSAVKEGLKNELEPERDEVKKLIGKDPGDVKLHIRCEGYASRKWETARNDTERKAKNDKLSMDRAESARNLLKITLGDDDEYELAAHGASVRGEFPAGSIVPDTASEHSAAPAPISEKEHPDQVKALESTRAVPDTSAKSDDDEARAVRIQASWSGYKLQGGYGTSLTSTIPGGNGAGPLVTAPGGGGTRGNNGEEGHGQGTDHPELGQGGGSGS